MAQYPTGSINAVPQHPEYVQTTGYCQMVPGSFKPNPDYDVNKIQGQAQGIGQQNWDAWKDKLDFQKAQLEGAAQQQTNWSSGQAASPNQQSGLGAGLPSVGLGQSSTVEAWAGDPQYAPWNQSHDCPHCGRCPSCGRGGYGYVPNYPPPYVPYAQPIIWQCTTSTPQAVCGNENRIY